MKTWLHRLRGLHRSGPSGRIDSNPGRSRASAEALEPRVLYSADPLGGNDLWTGAAEVRVLKPELVETRQAEATAAPTLVDANLLPAEPVQASIVARREIVFVDAAVDNAQELLDQLLLSRGPVDGVEVVTIASDEDGLSAIGHALQAQRDISAVHIISHGMAGTLLMGNSVVDADTLLQRQDDVGAWRLSLQADADILLWGCDVGSGDTGQDLLQELALLTGADVAASTDATGAVALGGNWLLERSTGSIEAMADLPVAPQWDGLLTISSNSVSSTASNGTTSLSWSHTVAAGSDRAMFVTLAIDGLGAAVTSVTYGGVALTQVGRTAGNHAVEIWRLAAPAVGTANVVVNFSGTTAVAAGAVVYNGVNLGTPTSGYTGATGTGTAASVNVSSATGNLVLDVTNWTGAAGGYTLGPGQSSVWSANSGFNSGRSSTEAGAATVTMSSTVSSSTQWEMAGVSINAANEAPVNTVPGAQATSENTALVFSSGNGNAIAITDADAGGANNEVTLSVTNGSLTLAGTAGLNFVAGDGTADASMSFRGTAAAINTALNGLSFIPTTNYIGPATLTLSSKDSVLLSLDIDANLQARYAFSGNANDSGSGPAQNGTLTNSASIGTDATRGQTLLLDGVNDYVDLSTSVASYSSLTQGTIAAWIKTTGTSQTIFSLSDTADTGSFAALQLGTQGYLTFSVEENGVYQFEVYQSSVAVNDGNWHHVAVTVGSSGNRLYVDGVQAQPGELTYPVGNPSTQRFFNNVTSVDSMAVGRTADSNGSKWLTGGQLDDVRLYDRVLSASEISNLVNDLSLVDTDTVAVTVNAFNAPPVNTVPAAQATSEDTALVFSSGNGNTIAITDADAGGANNEITLSVTSGTLTLAGTGGLSFVSGDGTADASMRFRGTATAINAALNGLAFAPPANASGGATLTLASKDSVLLNLDIGASLSARYSFENAGNLGQDTSPAGSNPAATVGAAAMVDGVRGSVVSLTGASNSNLQVTGLLGTPGAVSLAAWVNLSTADSSGSEVISMGDRVGLRMDQGGKLKGWYTYSGGTRFTETTVTLAGTGWHHVAYATDPGSGSQVLYLDGIAVASTAHANAILWTGGGSNTVIGSHGNGGTTSDFGGQLDEVRVYNRAITPEEAYTLANDLSMSDTDTVAVTVNAANDAPVLADTALSMTVTEDAGAPSGAVGSLVSAFTGGITDVDGAVAKGIAITTTNETNGVWYFSTDGGGSWSAVGAVSNTSALLLADNASTRLYFAPASNVAGNSAAALTLRAWDQTSGSAGNKVSTASNGGTSAFSSGTDTVDVVINAVNDAPVNNVPGSQVTPTNTTLVLSGANAISVIDVDATTLQVSLSAVQGSLTLNGTSGLSFSTGDGSSDVNMVFSGSMTAINTALNGLQFAPTVGFQGQASMNILTSDLGATGSGGTLTASSSVTVQVGGLRFQEGVAGYTGTQDTYVLGGTASTSYGNAATVIADDTTVGDAALLRFDNLFGSGVGQVPSGSTITSASLSFYVTAPDSLDSVSMHRMLVAWSEASTFNSLSSGIQANGAEAASAATTVIDAGLSGWVTINGLEGTVQDWANGAANHGWAFLSNNADNWAFASSENGTANLRPYLTVTYTPPQSAVITPSGGSASFTENGSAVAVDPGLTLTDADSTQLTGAVVAITGGFSAAQDTLAFSNQAGITGSWSAGTGELTLSGTATVAQYQTALRSITYSNSSEAPNTAARTVSFTVSDTYVDSATATRTVAVSAVNDAPVLADTALSMSVTEDAGVPSGAVGSLVSAFTGGASDVDAAAVRGIAITATNETQGNWYYSTNNGGSWAVVGAVSDSSALLLADNGTTRLYFAPASNVNGVSSAALTLRAWDQTSGGAGNKVSTSSNGGSTAFSAATDTVDVTITAVNDAPVLAGGSTLAYTENQAATAINTAITVSDVDNSNLASGTVQITGNYLSAEDVLAFANVGMGNIAGVWNAGSGTMTLTSAGATATLAQWQAALRAVTYANTSENPNTSARTISFTVNDGVLASNTVTSTVNVTAVIDVPTLSNLAGDALSYAEGDGAVLIEQGGNVTVTDLDSADFAGGTLAVSITAGSDSLEDVLSIRNQGTGAGQIGVAGGLVSFGGVNIGSWTGGSGGSPLMISFNANANAATTQALIRNISYQNTDTDAPTTGTRTVRFVVTDGDGGTSVNHDTTVTVTAVNDAPTVSNPSVSGAEDAASIATTLSGSDVDGTVTHFRLNTLPTNGTLYTDAGLTTAALTATDYAASGQTLTLYFVPATHWSGSDSFQFQSRDDSSALSAAAGTATLTVTAVNDAPSNTLPGIQVTAVNTPLVLSGSHAISVADVDAANLRVTINVNQGTLTLATTAGLTLSTGDGSADTTMVFTGNTAAINTALDGLQFTPTGGFMGTATLNLLTEDFGATGAGGPQSDSDSLSIVVGGQRFQEGVDGYMGTQDTFVRQSHVLTSYGNANLIELNNWLGFAEHGLIRFDQIFGNGVGQIPMGSTITSAALSVYVDQRNDTNSGATVGLYRMLTGWNEASTWFAMNNGVQTDGAEAASTASRVISATQGGWVSFTNIGADLQAWSDGAANHGWAMLTDDIDAWNVNSSETGTAALRPYLTVSFTPPQPAVVTASGGSAVYTENGAAVAVDPGLVLSDADSSHLTGAVVAISGGYVGGQDSLSFVDQNGITGSWNAGTGTLTLSGTATVAHYQAALRSVAYANSSDAFNTNPRTVSFSVDDAWAAGGTDSRTITLLPVNDAPNLSSGASVALTGTNEDTTSLPASVHAILTSAGWSDVDTGATPGMAVTGATGNGTWQFSADGVTWANIGAVSASSALLLDGASQLRYVPDNLNGETASLSFRGWDQTSGSAATPALPVYANPAAGGGSTAFSVQSASANLVVSPVNDAPVITASALTVAEGQTVTLVPGNLTVADPDNVAFTISVSGLSGGFFQLGSAPGSAVTSFTSAQLSGGLVQFVDDGDEVAPAFNLTVNDGALSSNTFNASITRVPVNDAPVITAASLSLNEGQTVTLSSSDIGVSDPDSSSFSFTATGITGGFFQLSTAAGTAITSFNGAQLSAGLVQFVDNGDEVAPSFSLTASDGALSSNTRVANISFTPVNDAPVLAGVSLTLNEAQTVTLTPANVLVNDVDSATFTFAVSSLAGGFFQLSSAAGTAITNFSSAQLSAGLVQFVDDGDEVAPSFSLTASDGALSSNTLAALVTSTPVNDAPVMSQVTLAVDEGATVTLSPGAIAVIDPDSVAFTFNVSGLTGGRFQLSTAPGTSITHFTTAQLNAGLVQFVDDGDELAPSFSLSASDGALSANPVTATVAYSPVQDPPGLVSAAWTVSEGGTVTVLPNDITVNDPDSSFFTFTVSAVNGGYFQLSNAPGAAITSFTTAQLIAGSVQFVDDGDETPPSVSISASDGALSSNTVAASISFVPVNDAPVIAAVTLTVTEGETVTLTPADVLVADPDSADFSFTVSDLQGGRFQLSSAVGTAISSFTSAQLNAGLVQFVDDGDELAPALQLTASDGARDSTPLAATITRIPVNDAPVIASVGLNVAEGETHTLSPADIGVDDPDSSLFTFSVTDLAGGYFQRATAPGVAIQNFTSTEVASATVQFVDDGDETAPRFSLTASDADWTSAAVAAELRYAPVNDAPALQMPDRVTSGSVDHTENSTDVLRISARDVDSLLSNLQFSLADGADAALFTVDSITGELRFIQPPDFEKPGDANADGVYEVVLRVTDPDGAQDQLALRVRVGDMNDAPVLVMPTSIQFNTQPQPDQVVATVAGTDQDAGDQVSFALLDNAEGRFAIDARTGEIRFTGLAPATPGGGATYTLRVEVTDSQGERRMRTLALVVPGAAPNAGVDTLFPAVTTNLSNAADGNGEATNRADEDTDTRIAPAWVAAEIADDADARAVRERIAALLRELQGADTEVQLQRGEPNRRLASDILITAAASADNPNASTVQDAVAALLANDSDAQAIRVADLLGRQWGTGRRGEDGSADTDDDAASEQQRKRENEPMEQLLLKLTQVEHVAGVGFSVGLVWWLTRGGGLLASALMGAPAWKQVDLLAVMSERDEESDADDTDPEDEPEEVKAMFDSGARRAAATVAHDPV